MEYDETIERWGGIEAIYCAEHDGHPAVTTDAIRAGEQDYVLATPDLLREIADAIEADDGPEEDA